MFLSATSLDDLLRHVFKKLMAVKSRLNPTRGEMVEITGVLLKLSDPRSRLSRTETKGKLYSCLGELFWYLSGSNDADHISYYLRQYKKEAEDGKIWGGYGPRLLNKNGINQIENVVALLRHHSVTRRAVIQLFDAGDIVGELDSNTRHKDIPCTCSIQFMVRQKKLHMLTTMRSNDAFLGLPHDVFSFTMLQEIVARSLDVELGSYKHCVGSLHLYSDSFNSVSKYLDEGWQPTNLKMPPMPIGDPWTSVAQLLHIESVLRTGGNISKSDRKNLKPYWMDFVRLLQIYRYVMDEKREEISNVRKGMHSKIYNMYIQRRQMLRQMKAPPEQLLLEVPN